MNKKISIILKILISAGILFVIFRRVPYEQLICAYKSSIKIYIFYGFIILFLTFIISTVRWRFLLSSLGIKATMRDVFYSSFAGLFFNLIFPSFVAGDIFRGFTISNLHGETKKVASSVLMDRFSGSFALMLVALFSFFYGASLFKQKSVLCAMILLCVAIGFAFFLIFSKTFFSFFVKILRKGSSLRNKIENLHDNLYFFKKNPNVFLKSMFFSVPIQMLSSISFFVISKAFGVKVEVLYFLILVPIIMMIALIPLTIAGIGLREGAAVAFLPLAGIDKSVALSISLLNFAFTLLVGILGGIFYLTAYPRRLSEHSKKTV